VPLRARGLRDRYILRLIAFERAIHVLVLSGLAVAVFVFIGHRQTVKHDYIVIINGLFGSSSSSKSPKGILGDFRHLFVISPSHLYDIGFLLVAYATLEAFEMVGLWFAKRWAEYLTFLATLLFVPLEVYELYTGFSSLKVVIFILNMAIVIYLLLGKRLFGLRGGHAADVARRRADGGWEAIDRRPPGQPLRRVQNVTPVATSLVVPGAGTTDGTTADSTMADSTTADGTTADGTTADGTTADGTADGDVDRSGV
jgi:uncharacterized membrane protein (DUF2068 family)